MKLFEDKSVSFQNSLTTQERLANGVYYTPADMRSLVFEMIENVVDGPQNILEPTCGTGEFIVDCEKRYPQSNIIGVELDNRSADIAREITTSSIVTADFMSWESDTKFDLIIGNPPYFTRPSGFKHNPDVVTCRSNICVEVLHKCITRHLSDKGIIAFVLPSSILNSKFYKPTMDLITSTMDVLNIQTISKHKFMGTGVKVIIFILRKKTENFQDKHVFVSHAGHKILNENAMALSEMTKDARSLGNMNVDISFGVTAASVKPYFTEKNGFPLICHANIIKKKNTYQQVSDEYPKKKFAGRGIVIPRGYGHGNYTFDFIDVRGTFIIENHAIAITGSDEDLDIIAKSFQDNRTREFCAMLCSGDISKEYVKEIPIFM